MKLDEFKNSLKENLPPQDLSVYLLSLWHDGKGEWDKAHSLIDSLSDGDAAHVHAYLHRKEGDISNADYWYRKAGKNRPSLNLEKEWESLVSDFL
ncbi:MAG: hypothetical protein WD426_10280 [Anditalea sp.]